jgi:hypothetical protein
VKTTTDVITELTEVRGYSYVTGITTRTPEVMTGDATELTEAVETIADDGKFKQDAGGHHR